MRIFIKLSGQGLGTGGEKYSKEVIDRIAEQIKHLLKGGNMVALTVGGGNIFRGAELVGSTAILRPTADYVGMLATVQNALVLRDNFEARDIETRVLSSIAMPQVCEEYVPKRAERHMERDRVVIFAAGLGAPFFTTDTTSVQRALENNADMLIMAKNNVDGLYSADPAKDPNAEKFGTITMSEVLARELALADSAAIALARDHGLHIKVVSVNDIEKCMESDIGTEVLPE